VTLSLQTVPMDQVLRKVLKGTSLKVITAGRNITLRENNNPDHLRHPLSSIQETITGTVTDAESGKTLPGVNILIKGTSTGVSTDANGNFELTVSSLQDTLVVSYIGYQTKEVPINGRTNVEIELAPEAIMGEEMVVVGYGEETKSTITTSISKVEGEYLASKQRTQVSQALQGAIPGVMVTRGNGAPGATAEIKIRGITTIGNTNPLYIVDGVPIDDINDINPNDIEDITVLKDAASASIYGARAASGVILVTTKRAKDGEFSLDYKFNYGLEKPTALPNYVNPIRYMEMTNELRWNDNGNGDNKYPTYDHQMVENYMSLNKEKPDEYPITDWVGLIMKDYSSQQDHFINISGGNKRIRSKASIGFSKSDALYDGYTFKKITTRINNDLKINDYLSAKVDFNFKLSNYDKPSVDPMYGMLIAAPIYAATWENGNIASGKSGNNIYASLKKGGFVDNKYSSLGGRLLINFHPIDGLEMKGVFSPQVGYYKGKSFQKQIPYYSSEESKEFLGYIEGALTTDLFESRSLGQNYTTQILINYSNDFGNHSFDFLGGYEDYYNKNESLDASREKYELNSFPYLNVGPLELRDNAGSANENGYRSFFGRLNYNFDQRYLLQLSLRRDGSSRFHPDYRWGNFPSISAGWILSNESFLKRLPPIVSFLKLRASWGVLGNERIGRYPYQASIAFSDVLFRKGNEIVSNIGAAQRSYNIPNITWETTRSTGIGIDLNLFKDRLQIKADYFDKQTEDMLLAVQIPDFLGFDNPDQNAGNMKTVGWEMQASWHDNIGSLNYDLSFNMSDFKSTMGDLAGTEFIGDKIVIEGSRYNEWYGYKTDGLFQSDEEIENSATINSNVSLGDIKYVDISGPDGEPDGKISPEYDKKLLGGSLPHLMFGGNIKLSYKGISLGITFQGVGKQNSRITPMMVRPLTSNWGNIPALIDGKYWSHYNTSEQNTKAIYPRLTRINEESNYTMSDYWLFNGAYFRLKNLRLGYNLSADVVRKLNLKQIRLTLNFSDLFTISNYPKGWDPEVTSTGYPITTQMQLGVALKF